MAEAKIRLSVDGATASVAALNSVQGVLNTLSGSVKSLGGGLAGLGLSLSVGSVVAYFAAINKGVDALNDLKDATGASIENISALEDVAARTGAGFDVVSTSLIKLNQALNTAKPGSDAEQALNAINLSVAELKAQDPAEAFRQVAVAMAQFEDDANKARLTQILFGKSLREVAPLLKDLADQGALVGTVTTEQAEATEKFNKELSSLNKNVTDVARSLAGPLVESLNTVIAKFREGRAQGKGFFEIANARYWENVRDFYGMAPSTGGAEGTWGDPNQSAAETARLGRRRSVGDIPDAGTAKAAADAAERAAKAAAAARKKALDEMAKAEADALAMVQKVADARQDVYLKEAAGIDAFMRTLTESASASLKSVNERIQSLKDEQAAAELSATQNISLAEAIEQVAIARLKEKQDGFIKGSEGYVAIERELVARRELLGLVGGAEMRKASKDAAKAADDEWQKSADQINQSLSDALMDAFMSGKDFGKTFVKSITSMFNSMVLKPVISAIVSPVAGAVTGSLGLSGTASAATGGIGDVASIASLFGAGGVGGSMMAGAGWLTGATTLGGSLAAGGSLIGTGTLAGGMAGAGMIAGALGPIALGLAAVYSLAKSLDHSGTPHTGGGAQYSAAGGLLSAQSSTFASGFTGIGYSASGAEFTAGIAQSIVGILDSTASAFGQKAGYTAAASFADDSSTDGAWGSIRIADAVGTVLADWQAGGQSFRTFSDGSAGSAEYLAAISADVRTALNGIDVPDWAKNMLNTLGDAPTLEQIAATVGQITAIQNAIVAQKAGLQQTLDLLTGVTTQRELERAALDESNRALYDQVKAAEDQKTAAEALADATEKAADAMERAMGTVTDEIARLNGNMVADSPAGLAYLKAQFVTATAAARAGDVNAMGSLAGLSQSIESASTSGGRLDLARTRAWLAGSLSATAGASPGGVFSPVPGSTGGAYSSGNVQLESLVQKLTTEVEGLRAEARATATHTSNINRQIERLTPDGDALAVREAAAL
jgi:hypothetical protein